MTAFTLAAVGVPMIYYGTEQAFGGGNDPDNREVLWNNLNQYFLLIYLQGSRDV